MLRHAGRFVVVGLLNTGSTTPATSRCARSCTTWWPTWSPPSSRWSARSCSTATGPSAPAPPGGSSPLFPLTNAANYVSTTVGVVVLVEWLSVDQRIAPLIAAVAAIPVTFFLSRYVLVDAVPSLPSPHPVPADGRPGDR